MNGLALSPAMQGSQESGEAIGIEFATADACDDADTTHPLRGPLAALGLSMLLTSLGAGIANVALPTLAQVFGASFPEVRWIVVAYLLATTTLTVGAGRLGDMTGRRRLLLAGIAVFTAASLMASVAPTLPLLVVARGIQGIGASAMLALATAFVADTVPRQRTGRAMGLLATTSACGTALGPSVGGLLISATGWRSIFLVNVPLGVLAFLLAIRFLPGDDTTSTRSGSVAPGGQRNGDATRSIAGELLRDASLRSSLAQGSLVSAIAMATMVVGPFYLSRGLGLEAREIGMVASVGPLVVALGGLPAGRLADRLGASRTSVVGLLAMATGCGLLSRVTPDFGIAGYVAPLLPLTAGYALFQTANNTAVMSGLPADRRGIVSGLLGLSRNIGLLAGTWSMGAVFALGARTDDFAAAPAEAVTAGLRLAFTAATVLALAALAMARGSWSPAPPPPRAASGAAGGPRDGHPPAENLRDGGE